MTDETKRALEAFVLQIIDAAKSGAQWTAEQTPLLVQEWLRWQLAENVIHLFFAFIGVIFTVWWLKRAKKFLEEDNPIGFIGGGVAALFGAMCGVAIIPVAIESIIKILVAPRVVVFEKFIELIK